MPSDDEPLRRGTSPDERAEERRLKLIAACRDIVGRDGSSALTIRSVCSLANVSPRKFYECFPDTDALLVATYDSAVEELLLAVASAARGPKGGSTTLTPCGPDSGPSTTPRRTIWSSIPRPGESSSARP